MSKLTDYFRGIISFKYCWGEPNLIVDSLEVGEYPIRGNLYLSFIYHYCVPSSFVKGEKIYNLARKKIFHKLSGLRYSIFSRDLPLIHYEPVKIFETGFKISRNFLGIMPMIIAIYGIRDVLKEV
ncbi:MAG: hypothetical protein LWW95_08245 [Candidatus Desulfofervidus auxilii]|nr:hypothetical protein [Candidatus Desulfofervidus auxilii]